ncbi:MAG: hypothetical protein U1G07_07990 [Verrucomicrobiota bacterium]
METFTSEVSLTLRFDAAAPPGEQFYRAVLLPSPPRERSRRGTNLRLSRPLLPLFAHLANPPNGRRPIPGGFVNWRRYLCEDMSETDLELLARYAREQRQEATEIVRRHVDLVYSAALRRVRSPHLAQEVAWVVLAGKLRHWRGSTAKRNCPAGVAVSGHA